MQTRLKYLRMALSVATVLLLLALGAKCLWLFSVGFTMDGAIAALRALTPMYILYALLIIATLASQRKGKVQAAKVKAARPAAQPKAVRPLVQLCLFMLALVFILLGVLNGGWYDVLVKAINICTECIGLG